MNLLRVELKKLLHLGWSYLAVLGMNAFSAAMLFIFVILHLKSTALSDAAKVTMQMKQQAGGLLYFVFVTEAWVFSFLGFFLLGILIGELLGREFESGSLSLLFLSPYTRFQIFGAKFLAVLIVYFLALGLNLCIQGATVFLFSRVHSVFFEIIEVGVLVKLLASQVLIDLSWIALMFLLSSLSRGVASTLAYTLSLYFFFLLWDSIVWLGEQFEFLSPMLVKIGAFSFTNSCRIIDTGALRQYFSNQRGDFPLAMNLMGLNLFYTLIFLLLAAWAFSRREI